ncbi:MAG: GNAT family N-acetyltransferase [Bacteroidaceae bacterium]|nr:GNAT family N-acetyltransferase [Bacteroidaceae bacterium]
MEKIIEPVALELIKAELTDERKLMDTNKGGNELYVVDCHNAPNTLREIGRLREITYRAAGGCSGKSMDLDEYDLMEKPYQQIIVWDPDAQAIIGGYRYILGTDVDLDEKGQPKVTSSHLYHFTDKFIKEYLPYTMELGRSFVRPEYQTAAAGRKSHFTLDNLWDGITGVVLSSPGIDYLFGKMTIYNSYDKAARELILHFLEKHFPDNDCLVRPYQAMVPDTDPRILELLLNDDRLKADYRNLKDAVHRLGTNIPPLINSYINTSSTMKIFGSTVNDELSDAIETGLMIRFSEINLEKKERHIRAFIEKRMPRFRRIRRTDLITPEIEFK